jgi:hypothetical protein
MFSIIGQRDTVANSCSDARWHDNAPWDASSFMGLPKPAPRGGKRPRGRPRSSKSSQTTLRLGNNVGRTKLSHLGLESLAKWLWPGHTPTLSLVAAHFETLKKAAAGGTVSMERTRDEYFSVKGRWHLSVDR